MNLTTLSIIPLSGALLSTFMAIIQVLKIIKKHEAENRLQKHISQNAELRKLGRDLTADPLDRNKLQTAADLIESLMESNSFDGLEKTTIEEGLKQYSKVGQANYILKLLSKPNKVAVEDNHETEAEQKKVV